MVDSHFSKTELLDVLDVPAERIDVVYPGVAGDYASLQRRPSADPFVLVPGTVERRKNLETVIRAAARVPQLRIISAGPPTPYRAECERIAEAAGVTDRLEILGYVSREELHDLYAHCTGVAVPSRYEGFGYAAAQALCAGAPVLAANASSLPEVCEGDAYALLPPDDEAAWAAAFTKLIENRDDAQRHASSVRERAVTRFAWDAAARAAVRSYERALAHAGRV